MAEVHAASQQVRRKCGFENRLHPAALVVQVILVAIQQVGLRILDGLGHTIERVRRQHIVLIQETGIFPAGQFKAPEMPRRSLERTRRMRGSVDIRAVKCSATQSCLEASSHTQSWVVDIRAVKCSATQSCVEASSHTQSCQQPYVWSST